MFQLNDVQSFKLKDVNTFFTKIKLTQKKVVDLWHIKEISGSQYIALIKLLSSQILHHNQNIRAQVLFKEYPDLKKAYWLSQELRQVFRDYTKKNVAILKLAHWYEKVEQSEFKSFATIMNTVKINYDGILNYFENRSTNASAESFNAKIKAFRSQFRGVRNVAFFLFRLTKIYA